MIIVFQSLFVLFSIIAVVSVVNRGKKSELSKKATIFWTIFWVAVIVVVIWPDSTQKIADYIGIGRGVDLVIYISVAVIFYLLFRLNVKIENLNRNITKVIRTDALSKKD